MEETGGAVKTMTVTPPPLFFGIFLVEVLDEGGIQDDPGALLRTVSFSVNKVLEASALEAHTREPPDKTSWVVVEDPGGQEG